MFAASDGTAGRELWSTDGTPAGTRRIADIHPGLRDGIAGTIEPAGDSGLALFAADDGVHGREPWLTDGRSAYLLAELRYGARGSEPTNFRVLEDQVLFTADDGRHGIELWTLDLDLLKTSVSTPYGLACGAGFGSAPTLTPTSTSRLGNANYGWRLQTNMPAAGSAGAVLLAATRDLQAVGPCSLFVGPPWIAAPVRIGRDGSATLSTPMPNESRLLGRRLYVQGAVIRSGGPALGVADLTRAHLALVGR